MRFCVFAGSCSNGFERSNPYAAAASCSMRCSEVEPEPGPRPPSSSGFAQSTMIFAGSKSYFDPRPLHSGQAPYTELKLNERGSSAGKLMTHCGHAMREE